MTSSNTITKREQLQNYLRDLINDIGLRIRDHRAHGFNFEIDGQPWSHAKLIYTVDAKFHVLMHEKYLGDLHSKNHLTGDEAQSVAAEIMNIGIIANRLNDLI